MLRYVLRKAEGISFSHSVINIYNHFSHFYIFKNLLCLFVHQLANTCFYCISLNKYLTVFLLFFMHNPLLPKSVDFVKKPCGCNSNYPNHTKPYAAISSSLFLLFRSLVTDGNIFEGFQHILTEYQSLNGVRVLFDIHIVYYLYFLLVCYWQWLDFNVIQWAVSHCK